MRCDWVGGRDYSVICHTTWDVKTRKESFNARALKNQPDYPAAKKSGDMEAAQLIVDRLLTSKGLEMIQSKMDLERFEQDPLARRPVVVVPISPTSKNVLPVLTAHNIAYQLGLGIDRDIMQIPSMSRTKTAPILRLLNQPEFTGPVTPGREYIIVDDNYTMGGTASALRSYIESNKGKVLCATVLADQSNSIDVLHKINAHEIRWNVSDETLNEVKQKHGWTFERHFEKEFGFGLTALTDREGKFVGRFPNQRTFFEAVDTAREDISARCSGIIPPAEPPRAPSFL